MAYWRMRLRDGFGNQGGENMWPKCREHNVAAITYEGIGNVDLSPFSPENHPPEWVNLEAPAKGSLGKFAWKIRGGDTIYIADSMSGQIVGMGFPSREIGQLAYRFDANSPIVTNAGDAWCHLIDMDWEENFQPFRYEHPRAAMITVLGLNQNEIDGFERAVRTSQYGNNRITAEDLRTALLFDADYSRYTPAALRVIRRKHVELSNSFKIWLNEEFGIHVWQEQERIDALFEFDQEKYLAEFKIAYQGNTKRAIREALGQILEYNHYPGRESNDRWLLILDHPPSPGDSRFIDALRKAFQLPLSLGWETASSFQFDLPQLFQK